MSNLRFTLLPKRGDAVLGDLQTKQLVFLKEDSFSALSDIDQSKYEIIGVVYKRVGNKVKYLNIANASKKWAERWPLKLTVAANATSGVLSIRESSDSWAANHDYTITWTNAFVDVETSGAEVVAALNDYFAANSPFKGTEQDWYAVIEDGNIIVHCAFTDYRQSNNTGKSGFTAAANLVPEILALANMLRRSGQTGGEGAISNWYRALAYYRNDNGASAYQGGRTSVQTSVKQTYPINLPTYLGTSTQNPGDFCAALRAIYGEGEAGWLKFMESCLPVEDTDWGNMGMDIGKEYTRIMVSKTYVSQAHSTPTPVCPAADYCYNVEHQATPKGTFYLPSPKELYEILDGIQYGTNGSRNADVVNRTLNKLNGSAISNGSNCWSAGRYSSNYAWYANGSTGTFNYNSMYRSYLVVPVSLFTLQSKA
jgi:hypothetical protein